MVADAEGEYAARFSETLLAGGGHFGGGDDWGEGGRAGALRFFSFVVAGTVERADTCMGFVSSGLIGG